jgi:hypothetical protein
MEALQSFITITEKQTHTLLTSASQSQADDLAIDRINCDLLRYQAGSSVLLPFP